MDLDDVLATAFARALPHLTERQQRLVLGAFAESLGHGGVTRVADLAGSTRPTVRRGLAELDATPDPAGRVRAPGGGPRRLRDRDPGLLDALDALVAPDSRGDPQSPLRWTTTSLRHLAETLTAQGHWVSPATVGRLLQQEGYALQGTRTTMDGAQHPDRDAQFGSRNEQARAHLAAGQPVSSVDTNKQEVVGRSANRGREWQPSGEPERVKTHDVPDPALGTAIPSGVDDLGANAGWVRVGTDHDTAAFAVATLRRWWEQAGRHASPDADRLLICADAGGSNGDRVRAWKTELARFAADTGLAVTGCHVPPGTSKWNRIQHRLCSAISGTWRGRPLERHQVIVWLLGQTSNRSRLRVRAELDPGSYPLGSRSATRSWRPCRSPRTSGTAPGTTASPPTAHAA